MPNDFKYNVFLSHSAKDKPLVRELVNRLKNDKLRVWFDEWELKPGDSIYAMLIAQLAHYEGFKKREFFQDAAAYQPDAGGRCLVRLRDHGRGQGELELFFDGETPASVRQGFLEFVRKHLESKSTPGSVTKRHKFHCLNAKCREPFDDRVVKANLAARQKDLLCPFCRKKTPLLNLLSAPTIAAKSVAAEMDTAAKAGRQRMTAGWVIKSKEAKEIFDVFLSHNAKDKAAVEKNREAVAQGGNSSVVGQMESFARRYDF